MLVHPDGKRDPVQIAWDHDAKLKLPLRAADGCLPELRVSRQQYTARGTGIAVAASFLRNDVADLGHPAGHCFAVHCGEWQAFDSWGELFWAESSEFPAFDLEFDKKRRFLRSLLVRSRVCSVGSWWCGGRLRCNLLRLLRLHSE